MSTSTYVLAKITSLRLMKVQNVHFITDITGTYLGLRKADY